MIKNRITITPANRVLVALLLLSFLIRAVGLSYNSLFIDEAFYIVLGKQILAGTESFSDNVNWIGGFPLFYPVLSAVGYMIGGVIGSRLISVLLGVTSVYLFYRVTKALQLWEKDKKANTWIGIISATLFSIAPILWWLSRLANYDMLAITLALGALVVIQHTLERSNIYGSLYTAILFILSFLAKYTVLLMFPLIFIMLLAGTARKERRYWEQALLTVVTVVLGISIYIRMFYDELYWQISTLAVDQVSATPNSIVLGFFRYTWIWYVLAVACLVFMAPISRRVRIAAMFVASLIPLLVHLVTLNSNTLSQNTVFSIVFLLPIAGYSIYWIIRTYGFVGSFITGLSAIIVLYYFNGLRYDLEHAWPDTRPALTYLSTQAGPEDRILAETDDVAVLALEGLVPPESIVGPFEFSYQELSNEFAYQQAVRDTYFTFIQLDDPDSLLTLIVASDLETGYELAFVENGVHVYSRRKSL